MIKKIVMFPKPLGYFDKIDTWHKLCEKAFKAREIIRLLNDDYGLESRAGIVTSICATGGECYFVLIKINDDANAFYRYIDNVVAENMTVKVGDIVKLQGKEIVEVLHQRCGDEGGLTERERKLVPIDFKVREHKKGGQGGQYQLNMFSIARDTHRRSIQQKKEPTFIKQRKQNQRKIPYIPHEKLDTSFQEAICFFISWFAKDGHKRMARAKTKWKLGNKLTVEQLSDFLMGKSVCHIRCKWQAFRSVTADGGNDYPIMHKISDKDPKDDEYGICYSLEEVLVDLPYVTVDDSATATVAADGWDELEQWNNGFDQMFPTYF